MKVLGLIPARGGSKGVPRKNIKLLAGKPLIQYTIEAALEARLLSKVIISTDDAEIAEVAVKLGVEVPFLRPKELAEDKTPTLPAIVHALNFMEGLGEEYDAVCLLQPTSPVRQKGDIDNCILIMQEKNADSVISMAEVPTEYNPHWVYFPDKEGYYRLSTGEENPIPRRQELPPAYHREGSIYLSKTDIILNHNSLFGKKVVGYTIKNRPVINIDTLEDWAEAEKFMTNSNTSQFSS